MQAPPPHSPYFILGRIFDIGRKKKQVSGIYVTVLSFCNFTDEGGFNNKSFVPPPHYANRAGWPMSPTENIFFLRGKNKGLLYILNYFDYLYRYSLCVEMDKFKDKKWAKGLS